MPRTPDPTHTIATIAGTAGNYFTLGLHQGCRHQRYVVHHGGVLLGKRQCCWNVQKGPQSQSGYV